MASVTHAFLLAIYFVGNCLTFLKQQGFSLFPITNGGSLSVPSTLQANRTVILSLEFFSPLQGSPFKLNVLLGGSLKNSPVSSAL
jgi:hypothetical protein